MGNNLLLLEWDSDFFDLKIGKIEKRFLSDTEFEQNLIFGRREKYDLLYVIDDLRNQIGNTVLKNYKLTLVDTKIVFEKRLRFEKDIEDIYIIKNVNDDDLQELYYLAIESGHLSRYKIDENLNSKFEIFYRTWIDNSLNKVLADDVFVYKINTKIVGFVSLKYQNKKCTVGLIAVNENYRGHEIGKKLMQKCFFEGSMRSCKTLEVATQLVNVGACRFYEKLGMKIKKSNKIYHSWIQK